MKNSARETSATPHSAPLRIFIADDSRVVHRYLALSLRSIPGTELAGRAFSGRDAVMGVREHQPDVLILDIDMPKGSGLDVLKAISLDEARPIVFMLTLHGSRVLSSHCQALGADRFFEKETDLPMLLDAIGALAAQPTPRRAPAGVRGAGFSPHETNPSPEP